MSDPYDGFGLRAPAKFNLRLEVLGRRPDGLHGIRSAIAALDLADELRFEPSKEGFSVSCDGADIAERANLAWLAAIALKLPLPAVHINIRKRIPMQAGLGGGSADAAAALRGVGVLFARESRTLTVESLKRAGAAVGADVPACLLPGLKIAEGAGEAVTSVTCAAPPWGILLLKPAGGLATAAAYELLDRARLHLRPDRPPHDDGAATAAVCDAFAAADFSAFCRLAVNDFQAVIEQEMPEVARAAKTLRGTGARAVLLCGSGSCVAALFESVEAAWRAHAVLARSDGDWSAVTRFTDEE